MSDTVAACPNCDSSCVDSIAPGGMDAVPGSGERYWCNDCGERFDQPDHCPPKGHRDSQSDLARELIDANTDEWP